MALEEVWGWGDESKQEISAFDDQGFQRNRHEVEVICDKIAIWMPQNVKRK